MAGLHRRLFHSWMASVPRWSRRPDGVPFFFIASIRLSIVLCAVAIALARWYWVDTSENYMVGYPSPRTYPARVATRFADRALTGSRATSRPSR